MSPTYLQVYLLTTIGIASITANCRWDKGVDFSSIPPILFSVARQQSVLPVVDGGAKVIKLMAGEQVTVTCVDSLITVIGVSDATATCSPGNTLDIGGTKYNMIQLKCSARPKESIQRTTFPCATTGNFANIGFEIKSYGFYSLVSVCFDHHKETNLFSKHTVRGASMAAKEKVQGRPSFKRDTGFFSVSPDACYKQPAQKHLFEKVFDIPNGINIKQCRYFAKGHMAPDADFVMEIERRATYYYINAVPQWQFFNSKNWKCLEGRVRNLADGRKSDIDVFTGTWQMLQMEDINSNMVDIYLGRTENKPVIPAPTIIWKVVYDASRNEAVAFVGVNSLDPLTVTGAPCASTSVCPAIKWFSDVPYTDPSGGVMHCCTVDDLKKDVSHAPSFGPVGLLTG
ncbi:DNA/RNA non-specific endonuclease [Trinorchestia longiramus]|nr:DNA/RNA non-specific endonuclease [Trinorchestia longiramus]